jgi:hypothetical protein
LSAVATVSLIQILDSTLQLTGVDFSDGRVLLWGKQKAEVYELSVTGKILI